jgi:hypothetical protein
VTHGMANYSCSNMRWAWQQIMGMVSLHTFVHCLGVHIASDMSQPIAYDTSHVEIHGITEDGYWTLGRSVLMGQGSELHCEHKHIAADGRVRSVPTDSRGFSLFGAVSRTEVVPISMHWRGYAMSSKCMLILLVSGCGVLGWELLEFDTTLIIDSAVRTATQV